VHEPWVAVLESNITPAGSVFVTATPAAGSGPLFVTLSV
jgi:hypothetical protein